MDWRDYEEITKYIYETIGKETGIKIEGHGSTCKVTGKSGVDHQIDVLTSHSDGIHTYWTAIECKYCEDTINKDIVMKLAETIEDAGINKGVIVSKRGLTEDGISFAEYKNIGLVELREIEEKDWKGREGIPGINVGILNIKTELRRPEILTISIDNDGPHLTPERINPYHLHVKFKRGEETPLDNYLMDFKKGLHNEEPGKIVQKYYSLQGAQLVNRVTKSITPIKGFRLTGKLIVKNTGIKWHMVDEVWLIMKALFEDKSFTISKMGVINERRHDSEA